jgi:cytochrome c2
MTTGQTPAPQPELPSNRRPENIVIILIVLAAVIGLGVIFLVVRYLLPAQPPQFSDQAQLPQVVRMTEEAHLNSLGWVNKGTQAAHIPIDSAMRIIATQGMPSLVEVPGQTTPQPTVNAAGGPAAAGQALFQSQGCIGCHTGQSGAIAPNLAGIYGKPVQLEGGQTVTADDAYIKESILNPTAKVAKGFQPIMPSFQGKVDDTQISDLIAYIKSLK